MCDIKQREFYECLSEEFIENTFDRRTGPRRGFPGEEEAAGRPESGIGPHLTLTKRKRKNPDGTDSRYSLQGRCMDSRKHGTTSVCSECRRTSEDPTKQFFVCNTRKVKSCYRDHLNKVHNL